MVEGRFWKLPISYHFSKEEVERLITKTKVVPAVNQLEFHPWVPWIRTFFVSFFCQGLGWRIHAKLRFFVQNENSSHRCVFFETVWYSLCISRNNLVTFKKWCLNKSQWQWMNLIDWIYLLYIYWNRPFFIAEVPAETRDLVRWCQEKGIVVTAYGSLGTEWGTKKWHLYALVIPEGNPFGGNLFPETKSCSAVKQQVILFAWDLDFVFPGGSVNKARGEAFLPAIFSNELRHKSN